MTEPKFGWVGGTLCLDFHNTVSWRAPDPAADETLRTYGDLIRWCEEGRVIAPTEGSALLAASERRPRAAAQSLRRAHSIRRVLHEMLMPLAQGREVPPEATNAFNGYLVDLSPQLRSTEAAAPFSWHWTAPPPDLGWVLRPVVWSAATLFVSDDVGHLKTCASERCGWAFLDVSRRRNRRWCDMRDCGNRAKVRRYYQRHRQGGQSGSGGQ